MIAQDWFNGLAPRERLLVAAAAALAVLAIIVLGIVRPLSAGRVSLVEQISDKRAVLADIERVAARFGPNASARMSRAAPSGESLVVLVDRTARGGGLGAYLKRNEPDGSASIRLRFENVPFDQLASWLVELKVTQAITVTAASTDPAQDAGRVNASLQLSRSATP